ncbi:MAG: hypothetical protein COB51_08300, partial [Moraxellaceae bacterium]
FDMEYTKVLLISKEIKKITVYFEIQTNRENLVTGISKELEKRVQIQYEQLAELNQVITHSLDSIQTREMTHEQMSTLLTQFSCACINLEDRYEAPAQDESLQQDNRHQRAG